MAGKWSARRPKKRRVKLVGGGHRVTVASSSIAGGSMKAKRRQLRKIEKAKRKRGK